jgi:uncharacterized protein DUF6484
MTGSHSRKAAHAQPGLDKPEDQVVGPVVGVVASFDRGELRVTFPSNRGAPVVARALSTFDDATLMSAAQDKAEAVLLFEEGDPARPLLVGLLRSRVPLLEALLAGPVVADRTVATVDGKRVHIEGKEEVVLQCGRASLTLTRDGRVVLRGVNIVSQADQVHKIRGGKVQVN